MPASTSPILWLKAGRKPVLQIVGRDKVVLTDGGLIDHVAFRATGYAGSRPN